MVRIHQGESVTAKLLGHPHPPHPMGSALTIGDDLREGRIPVKCAGKAPMTEKAVLARLRTMLWATDRDENQPWLEASRRCRAFWKLTPLLERVASKRELFDPTTITHSIARWRYAFNDGQKPYLLDREAGIW